MKIENVPIMEFDRPKGGRRIGSGKYPFRKCEDVGDSFFIPGMRVGIACSLVRYYNRVLDPWAFNYKRDTDTVPGIRFQRVK
jgi:hypothetical protein